MRSIIFIIHVVLNNNNSEIYQQEEPEEERKRAEVERLAAEKDCPMEIRCTKLPVMNTALLSIALSCPIYAIVRICPWS
ncbi:hypothetical protein M378DRAFT_170574 [Amanita muscaria Koide BX008]|uniref:Uncharacterized protein n=1 Tax=Amanita muscaria (strain Koide BX008) TaxID=946122 RepID=A0A0C2WB50_AMAMK|nr:hypothetical protein M378DRAFT_170574 [Amanita muscaria Koide BX008]